MVDYITPIVQHWTQFVWGDMLIGGIILMFFIALWGIKRNWGFDMYVIIFLPILTILLSTSAGTIFGTGSIFALVLIGLAIVIGLGLFRLLRG